MAVGRSQYMRYTPTCLTELRRFSCGNKIKNSLTTRLKILGIYCRNDPAVIRRRARGKRAGQLVQNRAALARSGSGPSNLYGHTVNAAGLAAQPNIALSAHRGYRLQSSCAGKCIGGIPTIIGSKRQERVTAHVNIGDSCNQEFNTRTNALVNVNVVADPQRLEASHARYGTSLAPSLYVLNAAALAKPHAVEHLAVDLASHNADMVIITETHFKVKHSSSMVGIKDY
jgi:hypothetical protein